MELRVFFIFTGFCLAYSQSEHSEIYPYARHRRQACGPLEFQCKTGKCIANTSLCNGIKDCQDDGSDETFEQCNNIRCSDRTFRCKYGACIDRDHLCDGRSQCADSSDEDPVRCGTGSKPSCKLPMKPEHGQYKVRNCKHDDTSPLCRQVPDTMAPDSTILEYQCDEGFTVAGNRPTSILCTNGKWSNSQPTCAPVCGKINAKGTQFVQNDSTTLVGEIPWHVGIYRYKNSSRDPYEQICGGSLISPNTIVAAAHCFWDEVDGRPFDKDLFRVAAGKYYRDWNVKEAAMQERKIKDIIIHSNYKGRILSYSSDISILKLNYAIVLTSTILPVCIEWSNKDERLHLVEGSLGTVAGWHFTQKSEASNVLTTAKLPFINSPTCWNTVPDTFKQFITQDKFCAGSLNGTTVCPGDSGAGLAFDKDNKMYLLGVVSVGVTPNENEKCNTQQSTVLFTRVSDFIPWLEENYEL